MAEDRLKEEQALIRRCLAQEKPAWEEFLARHLPVISGAIRGTLRRFGAPDDPGSVQDVVQDVCLTLLAREGEVLRRFQGECPLPQYLAAVAVHRTVDHLRRRHPALSLESGTGDEAFWKEAAPAASPAAPEILEASERKERIRNALSRLSPKEQAAVRLFYWDEAPTEAIGDILQLEPGSVRSLLTRCRDKLRDYLQHFAVL